MARIISFIIAQISIGDIMNCKAGSMVMGKVLELIKRRFEICKACELSQDDGFACKLYEGCCFGRWRSEPDNKCPAGKW